MLTKKTKTYTTTKYKNEIYFSLDVPAVSLYIIICIIIFCLFAIAYTSSENITVLKAFCFVLNANTI